jgi:drug/metabolite transporter (DMT)-like permease
MESRIVPGARAAACVATIGLALVLEPWHAGGQRWLGAALGALSAVGYAGNVLLTAKLVPRIGAARAVGGHVLLSAAVLIPLSARHDWALLTPRGMALLVISGVTIGALSGWVFSRSVGVLGPTTCCVIALLEPLVAVTIGWLAFGEHLSLLALLGGAIVLGAGAWVAAAAR